MPRCPGVHAPSTGCLAVVLDAVQPRTKHRPSCVVRVQWARGPFFSSRGHIPPLIHLKFMLLLRVGVGRGSHCWLAGSIMSIKILQLFSSVFSLSCLFLKTPNAELPFYTAAVSSCWHVAYQSTILCCHLMYSDVLTACLNSSYWLNAAWDHSLGCHIILQLKKLNLREVKYLVKGHPAGTYILVHFNC